MVALYDYHHRNLVQRVVLDIFADMRHIVMLKEGQFHFDLNLEMEEEGPLVVDLIDVVVN